MRTILLGATAVFLLAGAHRASAECMVSGDPGAVAKPMDLTDQGNAGLVASMTLLPKLMHIDYSSLKAKRPSCDLGAVPVTSGAYELFGDDAHGRQRQARPRSGNGPIATIVPVVDIRKAIEASKNGGSAPTEGYLLAVVGESDFAGWRFYTGIPDTATLTHDMADALNGVGSPVFRTGSDGKTELFVP